MLRHLSKELGLSARSGIKTSLRSVPSFWRHLVLDLLAAVHLHVVHHQVLPILAVLELHVPELVVLHPAVEVSVVPRAATAYPAMESSVQAIFSFL